MKKLFVSLIVLLVIILNTTNLKSQPLMGGDITWTCVGQDSFLISLSIYRDCNAVNIGSASIPIKCATTGTTITTLSIAKPNPIDITPSCATSCNRCESSSCSFPYGVDKYVFTKLLVLSSAGSCCKINISYSMCCRQSQITTIAANKNFYIEALLDRCVTPCNNSPTFTNSPINIICIGQDFVFNHGAIDIDRDSNGGLSDSLSFEWTAPLASASSAISYTGQYAYNKPVYFWGFPIANLPFPRGFHLDGVTGDISFRPMKIEQTVMVLKVGEWRNINGKMTLIGQVQRDIQFIVLSCPNNDAPVLSYPYYIEVCAGNTLTFSIATNDYDTKDTLRLSWNNAIPNASWSDNNDSVKHPSGTLSWTPSDSDVCSIPYIFTVTVKDDACPVVGSSTRAYQIMVIPKPKADISVTDSGCGNFYFHAQATLGKAPSFTWLGNFNPGFVKYGSSIHYKFKSPGVYPYNLTVAAQTCQRVYTGNVTVDSFLTMSVPPDQDVCFGDTAILTANHYFNKGPVSYNWSTGDTSKTIYYPVFKNEVIMISVHDTAGLCIAEDSIHINMHKLPVVTLGSDQHLCPGLVTTTTANYTLGDFPLKSINWFNKNDLLVGLTSQLNISDSGSWRCVVTDSFGCAGSNSLDVNLHSLPYIKFQGNLESCIDGSIINLNTYVYVTPSNGIKTWSSPSSGLLLTNPRDKFSPLVAGVGSHKVVIEVEDPATGCINKDSSSVVIHPITKPNAGIDVSICSGDGLYFLNGQPDSSTAYWRNLNGSGILDSSGIHYFDPNATGIHDAMTYNCVYNYTNVFGCDEEDTVAITVYETPKVNAGDSLIIDVKDGIHHLVGSPPGGTWSGPGVVGNAFDPVSLGVGIYTLYYRYINVICSEIDSLIITVEDEVGINESMNSGLLIYPNPSSGELFVKFNNPNNDLNTVYLLNLEGKIMSHYQGNAKNEWHIENINYPAGLYFLKIESTEGNIYYRKIMLK